MELRRINDSAVTASDNSKHDYSLSSVLNGKNRFEIIQENDFLKYQSEIMSLLADLIRNYTSGKSSSVKDETANQFLGSIFYTLDAYTANLKNSDDLLNVLRKNSIREIYQKGIKIIQSCLIESELLYKDIVKNKLDVPLTTYNDTLDKSIPEFFKTYDIKFNAQYTAYIADYPLVFDDMSKSGIFYIRQYLEKLQIETEFCRHLKQIDMLKVLYGYTSKFELDIASSPVNMFEIFFDQLVFSVLSGNEKSNLTVTPLQFSQMENALSHTDDEKIEECIDNSVNKIITGFQIENQNLLKYIRRYQQQFAERVISANRYGSMHNMVLVKGENQNANKNIFTDGKQLSDSDFDRLVYRFEKCDSTDEKVNLISENIHSVKDFIDFMETDCICGDEFEAVFGSIGDTELAVLGKYIFGDEMRQGQLHFSDSLLNHYKKSLEADWQRHLVDFLASMDEKRKSHIEYLINNLIIENDI